ncbi:MAG: putative low-complexity protein [Cyanobacteria bacterium RYN_339]|nr:putative low-complexity protein [Cyanobacteria bacterium RYN_339]
MARLWTRIALAAVLAGCAGQNPSKGGDGGGTIANHLSVRTAVLAGLAQAPASLIANNSGGVVANNGGTLVANNSSGVVSNHGGTFRLQAAEAWKPVPGAPVNVLDANEQPIAGLKGVTTDASGHFSATNVPAGAVVTVQIKVGSVTLTTLAVADGTKCQVDPASTVATARMREQFKDNPGAMAHASLAGFTALVASVQTALQTDDVEVKLDSPAAISQVFAAVVAKHPEIAAQEKALSPAGQKGNGPVNAPTDTPRPAATATPTPVPSPKPGGPTPTPAGTATPAPTPSPLQNATPTGGTALELLLSRNACAACDLSGVDLKNVVAPGADLHGATLQTTDATGIKLAGANLSTAVLRLAKLAGADLSGADLTGADLTGADLTGANLTNAKLKGAKLDTTILRNANLTGADFTGADAGFAFFDGATIKDAIFTGAKLDGAIWIDLKHCADGSVGTCQ